MRLGFHRLDFEYLLAPFYIASEVPEGSIWLCICLTAYRGVLHRNYPSHCIHVLVIHYHSGHAIIISPAVTQS